MKRIVLEIRQYRRVLFLLGNLAALAVVMGVFVVPLISFLAERDNRIEQQRNVLARLTAIAAQASSIGTAMSETRAQLGGGEFLIGPNENVISADLQTKVKAITEAAGARPRAVQALPSKAVGQVKYSGSRIDIYGPLQSIARVLHAIESGKPYLFVTGAVMKPLPSTRPGVPEEPMIQAQLDIFGTMHVGGPP